MRVSIETPSFAPAAEFEHRQQVLSAMTGDQSEAALSFVEERDPRYANR
jgi:enoyl-CoA hydratase